MWFLGLVLVIFVRFVPSGLMPLLERLTLSVMDRARRSGGGRHARVRSSVPEARR